MKFKFIILLCLLISVTPLLAQQKVQVSGVVKEKATNLSAIGVSVKVKGTNSGTVTDMDGNYTLSNVPSNGTLVFSYIGMNTIEEPVNGRTKINVLLTENSQQLDEVVVIGYGTSKAKDLTAPITVIKSEELMKHPTSSVMGALQGKVAGVQIVSSGAPGASPEVRIRGIGSFGGGNVQANGTMTQTKPLYVVDGMFYDDIAFLNTADIQDMSVLKDASASSIYGVRAANGVVIITTKKGRLNTKAVATYDGYVGFQTATNKLEMANSAQYAAMQLEKKTDTDKAKLMNSINLWGGDANSMIPATDTDWYKELLRTAMIQNHSLDVSGGTENATYSLGLNYLKQEGIMNVKNEFERFNIRAKGDYSPYKWLKVGANVLLSNVTKFEPENAAWAKAYVAPPIFPVYDNNRDATIFPEKYASATQVGYDSYYANPVATANYFDSKYSAIQVLPVFYAELALLSRDRLKLKTAYSQDITFSQLRRFTPLFNVGAGQENKASNLKKEDGLFRNWILDNTLTYQDAFGKSSMTAMLGQSLRSDNWRQLWGNATGVPGGREEYMYLGLGNASGRTVGDGGSSTRGLSYFGRVTYDYDNKYMISATMRADGSSKYQEKWGYFPSVGAAWTISEEAFMKQQKVVDFLKLRASWGMLGNDKIQPSNGFASVTQDMNTSGIFGPSSISGYTNLSYFNYLKWEVVKEYNLGFEARMFANRLSIEADYFHRMTENAVFMAPLPMGQGSLLGNNGKILNSGFELSLNWSDKINKDFTYFVGANISTLHNEVKDLNGVPNLKLGTAEYPLLCQVGEELNSYYGYKMVGVYQNQQEIDNDPIAIANGLKPGDFKYLDLNGDKKIDDKDRMILGSYIPSFTYSLNLGFTYKKFDFSVLMQGQTGNEIVNVKRAQRGWQGDINYDAAMVNNRWTGEGSTNSYPSALGSINPWNIKKFSSFLVEDGSYFRIQNIQAGYTFGKTKIGSFTTPVVRLSLTAERPYTSFNSNGFTPEVGGSGYDDQVYPLSATYTVGLRIIY